MKQQALDRKERAAWRDAQKIQADVQTAQMKTKAEEKRRAHEVQMAEINADRARAIAADLDNRTEADKELALK